MKRALVFGGAFNPPTDAHINLAEYAMKEAGFNCVIFVPSKMTYIKDEQGKNLAFTDEQRLTMLEKVAEKRTWMVVSDYEIKAEKQPRTYETLCHFRDEGYDCSLLFGSDKLPELETGWRYVENICQEFGIVCMSRSEDDCEEMIRSDAYLSTLAEYIHVVVTPDTYRSVSSTKAREYFLAVKENYEKLYDILPEELEGLKSYLFEK